MTRVINFGAVLKILGVLLIMAGGLMLTPIPFSIYHDSSDISALVLSSVITLSVGTVLLILTIKSRSKVGKREGYLIVASGWLAMSFVCTLPYVFDGTFPTFTHAYFEAVSGLTTTGASVLNDIEAVSHGILFWRSLTQWIGGMGIIVLTVAIFPLLGIGGVELFVAEAPGPTSDKIHPRIRETAKRLWGIYFGLTVLLTLILFGLGMSFFDAINHGLTTMATGGFSTKNASMAHFDSASIQYTVTLFMLFAGTNYTILYFAFKGKLSRIWKSEEFKAYLGLLAILIAFLTITVFLISDINFELAFRRASFQVLSIITTTGYVTADYTAWGPGITLIFFIMIFIGASAGSTSGGIKIIRHLVFVKNSLLEFKRLLHPNALIRVKIDGNVVAGRILINVLVFLLIYIMVFLVGSVVMAFVLWEFDQPLLTAIGSVATSLGNVGPGIGEVGPLDNFAAIPPFGKWFLAFLMLLGRLELFTILILFVPYFWKTN